MLDKTITYWIKKYCLYMNKYPKLFELLNANPLCIIVIYLKQQRLCSY